MKIYEITVPAKYPEFYSNANFNPSIIKSVQDDNLYIMSCRSFRRRTYSDLIGPINDVNDPNHPWYGGPLSKYWWTYDPIDGFWGTGIFLVRYNGVNFDIIDYIGSMPGVVDARLFRLNNSQILMTANGPTDNIEVGSDRSKYGLYGGSTNCAVNNCTLINQYILQIEQTGNKLSLWSSEPRTLCNNLSHSVEKNWSVWEYNDSLNLTYLISPGHVVFNIGEPISCGLDHSRYKNIFGEVEAYYYYNTFSSVDAEYRTVSDGVEIYYNKGVTFSLGTPALPFDANSYIGVGHAKISGVSLNKNENTPAAIFYRESSDMIRHPSRDTFYLMYFYTFNPQTFDIIKVSHSFLPPGTEYGVVFPCGLTMFDSNTFLISYGEADMKMKLLTISRKEIEEMLMDQPFNKPEKYQFIRM